MPSPTKKSTTKKRTTKKKAAACFSPALFQFLGELGLNNEREWFAANKDRYEQEVRDPALEFIRQVGSKLGKISKHYVAVDKKVGGSLMRVHRDTRFSKDKTPYKTNVGIHFRHAAGKDVHAPGLYVHIEVDEVFLGSGMWHPESGALANIRQAIVEDPARWKRASQGAKLRELWAPSGDSLKRPPRGFDPEHPHIDDLKRKDHILVRSLSAKDVLSPKFVDLVVDSFAASKPFLKFLTESQGLPF